MMYQRSLTSLSLTILFAATSIAAPVDQADQFKVYRRATGNARHGPAAFDRAYHKFGWTIPDGLPDALEKYKSVVTVAKLSTSGSDPVTKKPMGGHGSAEGKVRADLAYQNSEYLSPVTIGGQTLDMHLDTGSSDFWLFSTRLPKAEQQDHTIYNPAKSADYKTLAEASFKLKYGDENKLTGQVGQDTVKIGGVIVTHHTLQLPTEISPGIRQDPADGIVGLGFQTMNSICRKETSGSTNDHSCPNGYKSDPQPTWFENAKSTLKKGAFTVNMKPGSPGYYHFGAIDASAAKGGDIHYTPIDSSEGYWQFPTSNFKVGNGEAISYKTTTAIADSGSSLLMLEPEAVKAYYAAVPGAFWDGAGYSYPCDFALPDFTVALGDYEATIAGSILNYEPNPDGETCYGGIQLKGEGGFQVYGDILFNSQLVVFDYDNMRVGFAPHA